MPENNVQLSPEELRNKIVDFEEQMKKHLPNVKYGDMEECPLKHTFVDGAYVREIFMPKGTLLTSKIHKKCHPYFVMKGRCSVITENGKEEIEAPYQGITKAGTKRALYIHEDTVWITVHVTKETDLEKIEEEVITKNFDEIENMNKNLIEKGETEDAK